MSQIIKHPNFDHSDPVNDIALIILENPIELNENVKALDLTKIELKSGTKATVYGWGYTNVDQQQSSERLQKLEMKFLSEKDCQEKLRIHVSNGRICTAITDAFPYYVRKKKLKSFSFSKNSIF